METITAAGVLMLWGAVGWGVFQVLRIPAAPLFGSIVGVALARAVGLYAPDFPAPAFVAVQYVMGLYIGARITRDTVRQLRSMITSVGLIVAWALIVAFAGGIILSLVTRLDRPTAILSMCMGGLPEMTVIALATGAQLTAVMITQAARMVLSIAVLPPVLVRLLRKEGADEQTDTKYPPIQRQRWQWPGSRAVAVLGGRLVLSLAIAAGGGSIAASLGVPAGAMVGSTVAVGAVTLLGLPVWLPGPEVISLVLVAVGAVVSGNLAAGLSSGIPVYLAVPVAVATVLIFASSVGIAWIMHKATGWDLPTCLMSAAPAGLSLMTVMAIQYGRDPFRVSMLHLCRLVAIKLIIPFAFMLQ